MNTTLVQVDPASGDDHATLFDRNGNVLATVEAGTILKVASDNGDTMEVAYKNKDAENVPYGGGADTGVVAASPHTFLYADQFKRTVVSLINNGTPIEIIDDNLTSMFKVRGLTIDGKKEGWIEYRHVFRDSMTADE